MICVFQKDEWTYNDKAKNNEGRMANKLDKCAYSNRHLIENVESMIIK